MSDKEFNNFSILTDSRTRVVFWLSLFFYIIGLFASLLANMILAFAWLVIGGFAFALIIMKLRDIASHSDQYLISADEQNEEAQKFIAEEMPIGILVFDEKNEHMVWHNQQALHFFGEGVTLINHKLAETDRELEKIVNNLAVDDSYHLVKWHNRYFAIQVNANGHTISFVPVDETLNQDSEQSIITGMVTIDNYEEVVQDVSDAKASALRTSVTSMIEKWGREHNLFVRRVSSDRFLLFGYQIILEQLEEEKFDVLAQVRKMTAEADMPVTLSIGLAYGVTDLGKLASLAQSNLELAQGRGGDQVVVKSDADPARFYGGSTNQTSKRTRVRSRMITQALKDIIKNSKEVYIAGHMNGDMDTLGAALGVRRMAEMLNIPAYIVLDFKNMAPDMQRALNAIKERDQEVMADFQQKLADNQVSASAQPVMISDCIIDEKTAFYQASDKDLMVMVDHARSDISAASQLIAKLAERVVIIDHHRSRGDGLAVKPILDYIESYASSTSELVTEMLQFDSASVRKLSRLEATILLGGIQLDTRNFTRNTGARTFDAASYLRGAGADIELVNDFQKESAETAVQQAHLIETADIGNGIAIAAGEEETVYGSVLAAQVADRLMSIENVTASFVVTKQAPEAVHISARSNGELNVQLIMEALGGGGHLSNAAAQLTDTTIQQAIKQLKQQLVTIKTEEENN